MAKNQQLQDKYVLRLPDGLRDRIRIEAEANARSMNAEIVATLEEKYPATDEALRRALGVIDARIERAEPSERKELQKLRERLTVALYFEEPEA